MGVRFRKGAGTMPMHKDRYPDKDKSNRNGSWVMLAGNGVYTPLPGEKTLYTSPPRTTLSLQSTNRQSSSQPYSRNCKSGVVYLTNRRV